MRQGLLPLPGFGICDLVGNRVIRSRISGAGYIERRSPAGLRKRLPKGVTRRIQIAATADDGDE